jgi:uncharacterized protein YPO0396
MQCSNPPNQYPNLPAGQRLTQCLVDQFNDDEARWRRVRDTIAALLRRFRKQEMGPSCEPGREQRNSK